MDTLHHFEV